MPTRSNARAFLCSFTFSDGRRCRTPRSVNHPHLCYFHARKEAQSLAAEDLGRDIAYFFSGKYLSACDLNAALGRLFAAVAQGLVNPRIARTLAYLAQTMSQTIHLSQTEFAQAFGGDAWRHHVRCSANSNWNRINPDPPEDAAPDEAPAESDNRPESSASGAAQKPNGPPHHSPNHETSHSNGNLDHPASRESFQAPHPSCSTA